MQRNYIKKLLNLEDVKIKNIKNLCNCVEIYVEDPILNQTCPYCSSSNHKIHDYYIQKIKDIPIQLKPTTLIYRKRRYFCKDCGKKFYHSTSLINKYSRRTVRLTKLAVSELTHSVSQKEVSRRTNISTSIISKMLPYLAVTVTKLPRVLCIDEFKGNAGKFKYQVAIIDGENHKVIDILECRHKHALCDYFKRFPKEQLDNVEYLVSDLWETYKDIGITYFRKAKIIADHFHFIRYACNVVNDLRISVQKKLPQKERKYFKHSRKLLLSQCSKLNDYQKDELNHILINYSEDLRIAYKEKEDMLDILHSTDSPETKCKRFNEWILRNLESDISTLRECARTYKHWSIEIKNSFYVSFSNGVIEGFNNKFKTLKRISYGFRSFTNFKARLLLLV